MIWPPDTLFTLFPHITGSLYLNRLMDVYKASSADTASLAVHLLYVKLLNSNFVDFNSIVGADQIIWCSGICDI